MAEKPKRGARFEHARLITGSPAAGTARPVVCTVTAVRGGTVYYRTEHGAKSSNFVTKFPDAVGRWLDAGEGHDEALADLAELAEPQVHRRRLQLIADALNAGATWDQIGAALGQTASNAHRKYNKHLDVSVQRRVRVKPTDS